MPKHWAPLKKGDTIQIIAPASKTSNPPQDLKAIRDFLEQQWGLKVLISEIIFGDDPKYPELANTDEKRFQDLVNALENPQVKAIWCIRGGYGCIRLIEALRKFKPPQKAKLFIGFSDITTLLIYFRQVWGWNVIHGPVAMQAANKTVTEEDIKKLHQLMFSEIEKISIADLTPMNKAAEADSEIHSELLGGNLTLISRTLGLKEKEELVIKDKILVIEDIDEPFRKIDGILQQMKLQGYFFTDKNKPKAVILGDFTVNDPVQKIEVENVLKDLATALHREKIPVVRCENIGHGKSNHPLPIGPKAILQLGKKPFLTIESGAKQEKKFVPAYAEKGQAKAKELKSSDSSSTYQP